MAGKKRAKRAAILTPKQQRFVEEYLTDLNASAAALRAGYKSGDIGRQLLTKTHVQEAISVIQAKLAHKLEIKAESVLLEYARVAFSDIGQVLDFSGADPRLKPANEIGEDARRVISSIKVRRYMEGHGEDAREVEVTEFKLWDKLNGLEKLARHLGLLKDRLELTGKDGRPIEFIEVLYAAAAVDPGSNS